MRSAGTGAIGRAFAAAAAQRRAALVAYVTAGHPGRDSTGEMLRAVADAGADVIELGVPFSDPLADGPTIQRSSYTALGGGADLRWTLDQLARFRGERATPVVVFTYLNPVLRHGPEAFAADAVAAGADGLILTDLPVGGDPELEAMFVQSPLDLVRLVAPTSLAPRVAEIAAAAQGFLYYVSRTGVTGAQADLAETLAEEVAALRAGTQLPVAVGFGISTAEQVARVSELADGVVVGSALVDLLDREGVAPAARWLEQLRRATERRTS